MKWPMSLWRMIALCLVAFAVPPLVARLARAVSQNERRKRECRHLIERVRALLEEEFPDGPVLAPRGFLWWLSEPELHFALATPTTFALVVPDGQVRQRDVEYVVGYGSRIGCRDLRIYVHEQSKVPATTVASDAKVVSIRTVRDCPCGIGADAVAGQAGKPAVSQKAG
jgi:hypothetical protein